jgi:glutaredoxin/glutathione-dependent peroxiredoxin
MAIAVGDKLPDVTFRQMTADGPQEVTTTDFFTGRKVVLFAVPGAFTPTCSNQHVPGFIANAEAIKAKGVDAIVCVSVNDAFVLGAWEKQLDANGVIVFFADGNADFTRAIGLELDGSGIGLGPRSQRYAMVVDNGMVQSLVVEPAPGQAEETGAEAILAKL